MISYPKYEEKDDLRVKILKSEHQKIQVLHTNGMTIRAITRQYKVSRRTIQFILHPERKQENVRLRQERGGWKQYYDKKKHAEYQKKHRRRKKLLQGEKYSEWRKKTRKD